MQNYCRVLYLVVNIFALWRAASVQDVVVVTVVDDEYPTGSYHTGNVVESQLLITLVP